MRHRISAGALVVHEDKILLVRHYRPGRHDFWAPPGGGVEGDETLSAAAEREVHEETGIVVAAHALAYIDELIDGSGRMVKFWFLADYLGGSIDITRNPAPGESIAAAGWFARDALPAGNLFPDPLRQAFWSDRAGGFATPIRLPLRHSIF